MGGNSSRQLVESVTNITTETLTQVLQSSKSVTDFSQILNVDCTELKKAMMDKYESCLHTYYKKSTDDIKSLCGVYVDPAAFGCGDVEDVDLDAFISVDISEQQIQDISSKMENSLEKNLIAKLKVENSALSINNNVENNIRDVTNAVMKVINQNKNEIFTDVKGAQIINVAGGNVKGVRMHQTINTVKNIVQNSKSVFEAVQKAKIAIEAEASVKTTLIDTNILIFISLILGGLVLLLFLFVYVIKPALFGSKKRVAEAETDDD